MGPVVLITVHLQNTDDVIDGVVVRRTARLCKCPRRKRGSRCTVRGANVPSNRRSSTVVIRTSYLTHFSLYSCTSRGRINISRINGVGVKDVNERLYGLRDKIGLCYRV